MESFGNYIRLYGDAKKLPLRKVDAYLDIDTSTLSKIERNERPASSEYLKPFAEILQIDFKEIQSRFIADRISKDFWEMEHLSEGLQMVQKHITHSLRKKEK